MKYINAPLDWRGIRVEVAFAPKWLASLQVSHIELRCAEPLPLTDTGYLSCFLNSGEIDDIGNALTWAEAALDEAAAKQKWRRERQLSLF